MIQKKTNEEGIGIVLLLIIIAAIGIAGIAGVTVYNQSKLSANVDAQSTTTQQAMVQTQNQTEEAKNNAYTALLNIKANLVEGSDAQISTALDGIASVRANLKQAYLNTDATAKAQWSNLDTNFAKLEAQVSARSNEASSTLNQIMASLNSNQSVTAGQNTNTNMQTNGVQSNTNMQSSTSVDSSGNSVNLKSNGSVDTSGMLNL